LRAAMDLVRAKRGVAASSGATLIQAEGERSGALSLAHQGLARACADLDDAMRTEADDAGDDDSMATPALLGLLLDAVTARRHLREIETRQEPRHLVSVARDPCP
jgi:hypothetical protein